MKLQSPGGHLPGISQVKAAWAMKVAVELNKNEFGPICIREGVLQWVRGSKSPIRFAGRVDPIEQIVHSRVGSLSVRGWTPEDGDIAPSTATPHTHHPLVTIATASIAAPVESIDVPLLMLGTELAPEGCDFSTFSFAPTAIRAVYNIKASKARLELAQARSYLWLGAEGDLHGLPLAHIDLTRARLEVSRVKDLARLAFMFAGLHLDIGNKKAWIADARETCRVMQRTVPGSATSDSTVLDTRSTLVVEFPPQHVFEESLFRPGGPKLPDVDLKEQDATFTIDWSAFSEGAQSRNTDKATKITFSTSTAKLMRQIEGFEQPYDRWLIRSECAKLKVKREADPNEPSFDRDAPFAKFSERFEQLFRFTQLDLTLEGFPLPTEQVVYIGSEGMDADVAAVARQANGQLQRDVLLRQLNKMLKDADDLMRKLKETDLVEIRKDSESPIVQLVNDAIRWIRRELGLTASGSAPPASSVSPQSLARLRERAVSSTMQEYGFFRDFYLEQATTGLFDTSKNGGGQQATLAIGKALADDLEFFSLSNRDGLETTGDLPRRQDYVLSLYVDVIRDATPPKDLMRARLAGASRLAFRVDCGSRQGRDIEEGAPTVGGTRLPFSFDALTDWSRFDLAVTPRAMQVPAFDDSGTLIRLEDDARHENDSGAVSEDIAMLRSLGIQSGRFITAQERIAEVESSLKVPPTSMQTAIELPARLILSPSQKALWRTRRVEVPWLRDTSGPSPLWTADLTVSQPDPLVRAVFSPDLRPGFVRGGLERALVRAHAASATAASAATGTARPLHTPVVGAPPRGPRAPWTLGIEESDPAVSSLRDIYAATRPPGAPPQSAPAGTEFCKSGTQSLQVAAAASVAVSGTSAASAVAAASDQSVAPAASSASGVPHTAPSPGAPGAPSQPASSPLDPKLHPLVDYLCGRQHDKNDYGASAIFRSSLDAYDRHELVLLSSAWGLPVRGRREKDGQLQTVKNSSQVELPAEWWPIDLEAGSALYRPRALKVQELALSALGGTLRHDSDFVPPSAARHVAYGPLFDSLSIERWQHWTVLGRDVFAEVVYKGYLFPIGHRASLVKQTERVFLRYKSGGSVRAYLRQRMFIRIAQPDKTFPAPGQPNGGRQFPAGRVRMLTLTTPDIVDPAQDTTNSGNRPSPAGRLFANEAGLVFWPRTARVSGAEVHFEMQVENAVAGAALIFVDNVAINRPELMERLVADYNLIESPDVSKTTIILTGLVPSKHQRTLDMAGQVLRYCDELKPGSASHKTLSWTLKATGGRGVSQTAQVGQPIHDNKWEGSVRQFDDPSLEGADQPPFYPAVETARIRVDQVERITCGSPQLVLAQFDGWYVKNGFAKTNAISAQEDTLQIYLDIVNYVTLSMGESGDRSGGVMRPAGQLVALSRQRGPLSGEKPVGPGELGSVTEGGYPVDQIPTPAIASPAPGVPAGAPTPAPPSTEAPSHSADPAYKQFFNSSNALLETRILGLVPMSDLLQYLKLDKAANGLPLLKEAVEYGVGGLETGADVLRKQVITPLYGIVYDLNTLWLKAGEEVGRNLPEFVGSMADVFPDVDQALKDLLMVLGSAAGSSDNAALFASLAEIYETGRRLVDACGRVVANPLDRVQIALQQKLDRLSPTIANFRAALTRDLKAQVEDVVSVLVGTDEQVLRLFEYPFDWMIELSIALDKLSSRAILKQPPRIDKLLKSAIDAAASPGEFSAEEIARMMVTSVLRLLHDWLEEAQKVQADTRAALSASNAAASAPQRNEPLAEALALIGAARKRVEVDITKFQTIRGANDSALSPFFHTVTKLLSATNAMAMALKHPNKLSFGQVSQALADFLEFMSGRISVPLPDDTKLQTMLGSLTTPFEASLIQMVADPTKANQTPYYGPGGNISDPKNWVVPGGSTSLVVALHKVAVSAWDALKSESLDITLHRNVGPMRAAISALGYDALYAESSIHAATVRMKLAADVAIVPKTLGDSIHSLNNGIEQGSLFTKEVSDSLGLLIKDIKGIKDVSPHLLDDADDLINPIRDVFVKGLDWLKTLNDQVVGHLESWQKLDDASARPLLEVARRNGDAIARARKFDATTTSDGTAAIATRPWLAAPDSWWPQPTNPKAEIADAAATVIGSLEQAFAQQVLAWRRTLIAMASTQFDQVVARLMEILAPVVLAYKTLDSERTKAFQAASDTAFQLVRGVLLVNVNADQLYDPEASSRDISASAPSNDQLHWDLESLNNLSSSVIKKTAQTRQRAAQFLNYFLRSWSTGNATPLRIVQQVQRISLEELRAKLLNLIDFAAIREEIEDQIKLLIPSAATVAYDFETSIGAAAATATKGVFMPREGCALSVHSTTRVDLLKGLQPKFSSVGQLGAFDIALVGTYVDALTLHFNGVRFESHGGPVDCDLQYAGFTIEKALKFISDLQPFFGSKPGTGFYLKALETGIGMEAGYGLNLGTISIGTLSFFNVSLNAAARLPFDDRHATFVASLSRRDAPFTISIAPYGGSGFFALEADTKGIVGFEASFEYGGAGAFAYGPLKGQGRIMTGIYIRSSYKLTEISATFYVGGSASIWIFSFGASLYVNARPAGKKMVGDATYSFSFSMGIVDFDYHVTVHVSLDWGAGAGSDENKGKKSSAVGSVSDAVLLAEADTSFDGALVASDTDFRPAWAPQPTRKESSSKPVEAASPRRQVDTWCQAQDWQKYSDYFVLDSNVDVEEFAWPHPQRSRK